MAEFVLCDFFKNPNTDGVQPSDKPTGGAKPSDKTKRRHKAVRQNHRRRRAVNQTTDGAEPSDKPNTHNTMTSELIVDARPDEVQIALLEDSRLVSLQKEARNIAYAVGDIYLAKVKKLMPGLNAAFVNVGYEKDAFLHYLDLGPHFASYSQFMKQLLDSDAKHVPQLSKMKLQPDIDKHGSITEQLEQGRELMVQIVKEPISSKGPRLTTEITFTGRYMVLIPFCDKISISQKIKSTEEKVRLRQLIDSIKPKNFGVIVRTSAEGKRVAELNHELKSLIKNWEDACAKARTAQCPSLIFEEESRIVGMLRDVFSPTFEAIYVNDRDTYTQIANYVNLIAPERHDIVKLYQKPQPIFDAYNVTRQIKSAFGKTVSFKSGAYIIIEHTEALHVIDVNSGNRTKATNTQEDNALQVNLRAADEIARQLRLRDMGGIIVVDFIDMNKPEHRQELYDHMREVMANDRARHNILPLSKFGLMQITRQRVRPVLDIHTEESCPSCMGKGVVQPSLLFTDTLHDKIEYAITNLGLSNFKVYVHPFVDAYLKKGWLMSLASRWRRAMGSKFKIYADESLAYLQYRIVDSNGNDVDVKQEKDNDRPTADKANNKAATRSQQAEQSEAKATPEKPKAEKPKADKPKAEKPKTDKPKVDKPAAEKPVAEKPKGDKPKADKPKADKPKAEKPKAEKPADKQPADKPADSQPSQQPEGTADKKPKRRRGSRKPKSTTPADTQAQPAGNNDKTDNQVKTPKEANTDNNVKTDNRSLPVPQPTAPSEQ